MWRDVERISDFIHKKSDSSDKFHCKKLKNTSFSNVLFGLPVVAAMVPADHSDFRFTMSFSSLLSLNAVCEGAHRS